MRWAPALLVLGLGGLSLLFARGAAAAGLTFMGVTTMDDLFRKHAALTGVPWQLLRAIAMTESSLNPNAVNEEWDGAGGVRSIGLMQVLCPQKLNVQGWCDRQPCDVRGCDALFDPDINVGIGAQIIAWNLQSYGAPRGVAVYNRYAERDAPLDGPFVNQSYVNRVLGYFTGYGGDLPALRTQYGDGRLR